MSVQQKKIGIFIQWGFHEIRSIVLSNLAKELNSKYNAVIYTFDKDSNLYHKYLTESECPFVYLGKSLFKVSPSRISSLNLSIRKAYMRINGVGNFRNYEIPKNLSLKDYVFGNKIIWLFFAWISRNVLSRNYQNEDLIRYFKDEGLTDILMVGYSDINNQVIAFSAKEAKIKVWGLVNSWKDLYTNDFVSFTPEGLFTWSDNMAENFVTHNPHLKGRVKAVGNPAFDVFIGFKPVHERSFYESKYGIKQNSNVLVYTMINPMVTSEENLIISLIHQSLKANLSHDWHLLVRKNPLHHNTSYPELEALDNLSFMEHYWEWDPIKDLAVQQKEGEIEWYDLIHFSSCNISVASTVSMEFLVSKKNVINIGFNGKGCEDANLVRFSDAPYYKKLCKEPNVFICNSIDQFNSVLANFADMFVFDNRFQINEYFKTDQKSVDSIISLM